MALTPHGLVPVHQLPVLVHGSVDAHRHGRGQWRMAQLGLARPLHPHGATGQLPRQPSGIPSHVISAIVAITSCAFHVRDLHLVGRQIKRQSQVTTQVVNALAVGPNLQRLFGPLRQGAAQTNGGVLHKRPLKIGDHALVHGWAPVHIASGIRVGVAGHIGHNRGLQRLGFQPACNIQGVWHFCIAAPKFPKRKVFFDFSGDLAQSVFGLGQHAQQQTVTHDLQHACGAIQSDGQRVHVVLDHFSAECAGAKHHAVAHGVQRARHHTVVDVFKFTKHFGGHIGAQRRRLGADQVMHGMRRLNVRRLNRAVPHGQACQRRIGGSAQRIEGLIGMLARCVKQPAFAAHILQNDAQLTQTIGHGLTACFAPMCRRTAQGCAGMLNRQTARSHGLVWTERGAGGHHVDLLRRQAQLFGHDQPQRVRDALPQIDFA